MGDPNIQLVTVLQSTDPVLLALAQSLLEDARIDHWVRGETLRNVTGFGALGASGASVPEIQVRQEDAEEAAQVLSQLST